MAKTKGQQQQQAGLNPKPSSSVSSPGKRGPPRDRASPSPGTTIKKRKSASANTNTSLDELAGVEGLEDIAPTSGASNSKEDALTPGFEATEARGSNCLEEESFPSSPARGFDASSSVASNPGVNASSLEFDAPEVGAISSNPSTLANSSRLVLADADFLFLIVVPGLGDALSLGGPRLPGEDTLLDGKA